MKPQDSAAEAITFGVEIETTVPGASGIEIGILNRSRNPLAGRLALTGEMVTAPLCSGAAWVAERDSSIRARDGREACEFVSPVLSGTAGVENLLAFAAWAKSVGANVNGSCGLHITVGVKSIIGTDDQAAMAAFARKLAHITRWHARSLYGQTGTGRHLNSQCFPFTEEVGDLMREMEDADCEAVRLTTSARCGRGMVNFRRLFTHGVIEFRLFAGTLNRSKLLHHLATVLGLCRRAAEVERIGGFARNQTVAKRTATASGALEFLWEYLGWTGNRRPAALGLFGPLHSESGTFRKVAARMCRRFDRHFPGASL